MLFKETLVLVRGGGDLASGVIYRLRSAGFPIIVTELPNPTFVRRPVCYGEAVYSDKVVVENLTARLIHSIDEAIYIAENGDIPVLIDESSQILRKLNPVVVVDARMAKINLDSTINDAPLVITLGPGFEAGIDCHAVIETNRGHYLGRVIKTGIAEADTGSPGAVKGYTADRVLRASTSGYVIPHTNIGDTISKGQKIASIENQPMIAAFDGVLRGLIHEQVLVSPKMKIGDLDPRGIREHCFTISDKSLAIGGGVLEAILSAPELLPHLRRTEDETTPSV